jgi:hypothetical protein
LTVASALIVLRPRRSVADLVAALDNELRRLDVLSLDEDLSVRATFDLSYRSLPAHAVQTYHAVGIHPGALISGELVAAICGSVRALEGVDSLLDVPAELRAPRRRRGS